MNVAMRNAIGYLNVASRPLDLIPHCRTHSEYGDGGVSIWWENNESRGCDVVAADCVQRNYAPFT